MRMKLHIWRQESDNSQGKMVAYDLSNVSEHMSFLEMIDVLNDELVEKGQEAIAVDSDCREGICGSCGLVINGRPHGPTGTTTCQLHMRSFQDGDEIWVEPWRAKAFPIVRDLVVDRGSFDHIIQSGGYVAANTGGAPDGNTHLISKEVADQAMDQAECIGCGACVAACPNAAAMLFTSAKVTQLAMLPQGQPERSERVRRMVSQMDQESFGACSNHRECEAACPKGIKAISIVKMNKELFRAATKC